MYTANETTQSLSFNDGKWTSVKKTGRFHVGTIDKNGALVQMYVMGKLEGEKEYVVIDNLVFLPA